MLTARLLAANTACVALLPFAARGAESSTQAQPALKPYVLSTCFISDKDFDEHAVELEHEGRIIKLCCEDCEADFERNPKFYLTKLERLEKEAIAASQKVKNISFAEFEKLHVGKSQVVLDVRTPKEFTAGSVPGAVHLDPGAPDIEKRAAALDKSKTYLVVSTSGVGNASIFKVLNSLRVTNLFNLEGGFIAWEKTKSGVHESR